MAKKLSPYAVDIIKTCSAFGLSLGLQLYIIGVLFGGWLDKRLGTAPLFQLLGILAAIFLSFFRLISDFKKANEAEDARNAERKPQYIKYEDFKDSDESEEEKAADTSSEDNTEEL